MLTAIQKLYELFKLFPQISTDTRNIKKDSLFFALKGPSFNGNSFALRAIEQGCSYAVVDEKEYCLDKRFVLVEDVLTALQELAKVHRWHLKIPFIGITGSNGKTTTKELVATVLAKKFKTFSTKGNLNNHIGVPLSILSIDSAFDIAVIEMGANHQGEIKLLSSLCDPDFGLITNIGKAHLEGFGGIDGIIKGKGELYDHLKHKDGIVFLNSDSEVLKEMSKHLKTISYGTSKFSEYQGSIISVDPNLVFKFCSKKECIEIPSNLVGDYNLPNLLVACSIGDYFGVPLNAIKEAIEGYYPDNNRSQMIQSENYTLILDAYNANPTSMEAALKNYDRMNYPVKDVIIGDMLELGAASEKEHQAIIDLISRLKFDQIYLVGRNFKKTINKYAHFDSVSELIHYLEKKELKGRSFLVKGSRGMQLEKVSDFIQKKEGM